MNNLGNNVYSDFLTEEVVFISKTRMNRPFDYKTKADNNFSQNSKSSCPFCPEHRELIDNLVFYDEEFGVAIVENKYPIINVENGVHDVFIEGDDHLTRFHELSDEHVLRFFEVMQKRYLDVSKSYSSIAIIKNEGLNSGATLYHSHWQLIANNFHYRKVETIARNYQKYYNGNNKCYLCESENYHTVYSDELVKVTTPKVSKFMYTTRIFTNRCVRHFGELNQEELNSISRAVKYTIKMYNNLRENPSYNITFNDFAMYENGHFYIEISLRLGKYGGFELLTDCFNTSLFGEDYASILKDNFKYN